MKDLFIDTLRKVWALRAGRAGIVILTLAFLSAAFLPLITQSPIVQANIEEGATRPSTHHVLGTDQLNRDILARIVWGGRTSLTVAFLSVLLSVTLGAMVGLVAGYHGGWLDALLMRLVDGALSIPRLFILLLLLALQQDIGLTMFILVLGTTGWFGVSRIVRGEALRLRHASYVQAAEALGARSHRVIFRHLFPNAMGPLLVAATLGVGDVILLEAGLSFLGLGIMPPTPSWGGMIHESREIMFTGWWTNVFPLLSIVITVLAVNLVGEALRDVLDPMNA
ncbi:MAG: ABC transporter permease [Gemmatimonadota bacterium]